MNLLNSFQCRDPRNHFQWVAVGTQDEHYFDLFIRISIPVLPFICHSSFYLRKLIVLWKFYSIAKKHTHLFSLNCYKENDLNILFKRHENMAMLCIVISLKQDLVITYKELGRHFKNKIYLPKLNYVWKHQTVVIGEVLEMPCETGRYSSHRRWSRYELN